MYIAVTVLSSFPAETVKKDAARTRVNAALDFSGFLAGELDKDDLSLGGAAGGNGLVSLVLCLALGGGIGQGADEELLLVEAE